MEERLINKRIKEVMDEYPFKKPPLIGVYGVDNENIKVYMKRTRKNWGRI